MNDEAWYKTKNRTENNDELWGWRQPFEYFSLLFCLKQD